MILYTFTNDIDFAHRICAGNLIIDKNKCHYYEDEEFIKAYDALEKFLGGKLPVWATEAYDGHGCGAYGRPVRIVWRIPPEDHHKVFVSTMNEWTDFIWNRSNMKKIHEIFKHPMFRSTYWGEDNQWILPNPDPKWIISVDDIRLDGKNGMHSPYMERVSLV